MSSIHCSECSKAVHVVHTMSENGEKLKLLQQAHCAKCWRPLIYEKKWPGSHESQRPPFYTATAANSNMRLSVAQCGHVFHSTCAVQESHCPVCFVLIMSLRPFHFHTKVKDQQPLPRSIEVTGSSSDVETMMDNLTVKMELISDKVSNLQRQISKLPR